MNLCTKPVSPSSQSPWQCAHPSLALASLSPGEVEGRVVLGTDRLAEEIGFSPCNKRPDFGGADEYLQ